MKVLFLMFAFPEMNKSFNMYTTIVEEFIKNNNDVVIVAPGKEKTKLINEAGVDVLRVKTLPIKNVPNFLKGVSNLLLPFQFRKALKKNYSNKIFDLIICPTPPITLVDVVAAIKKKNNPIFYLILRDIFPQNAVDLGFMKKNGLLHRYFRGKEMKLYKTADHIGCMSQGNIRYLIGQNPEIETEKLHELKNFQKLYKGTFNKDPHLRRKYSLDEKFVVVFGGNMGKPQQLENVLELAKRCQEYPDVLFLLLGEGLQMKKLSELVNEQNILNIRIQGTIKKNEYQDLISTCDLGLISLHKNFTIPNIPSKSLDYFNVGLPVLASIDNATDFGIVLTEANAGLWSYSGDHKKFKKNFDLLYRNPELRNKMGKNGREYFEKFLTPEIAYNTIISKIKR